MCTQRSYGFEILVPLGTFEHEILVAMQSLDDALELVQFVRLLACSDEDTAVEKQNDDQWNIERCRRGNDRIDQIGSHAAFAGIDGRTADISRLTVDTEKHRPVGEKNANQPDTADNDEYRFPRHFLFVLERIFDGRKSIEADSH